MGIENAIILGCFLIAWSILYSATKDRWDWVRIMKSLILALFGLALLIAILMRLAYIEEQRTTGVTEESATEEQLKQQGNNKVEKSKTKKIEEKGTNKS